MRAIKIKFLIAIKKRLSLSKWTTVISIVTIVTLTISLTFIIKSFSKSGDHMESHQGANLATQKNTSAPVAKVPDWKMVLVNRENPINPKTQINPVKIGNNQYVDERIYSELKRMLDDAKLAGKSPLICSSYRTQEKQKNLYDKKVSKNKNNGMSNDEAVKDASGWVAYPGTSEHQLGLAVDIVDLNHQALDESQEKTATAKWLLENCQNYGFILRYPTNKSMITGVNYEPWHYRYVGTEVAKKIMKEKICLEEYLSKTQSTK